MSRFKIRDSVQKTDKCAHLSTVRATDIGTVLSVQGTVQPVYVVTFPHSEDEPADSGNTYHLFAQEIRLASK